MVKLRPVVLVREIPPMFSGRRASFPSLRDYVSATATEHEPDVITYLSRGVLCGLCYDNGLAYDVLERRRVPSEITIAGASEPFRVTVPAIMTDGTWVWPNVLLYYVGEYHLRLPTEFVEHAASRQWLVDPASFDVRDLEPGLLYSDEQSPGGL
jgi:hypothetical protein